RATQGPTAGGRRRGRATQGPTAGGRRRGGQNHPRAHGESPTRPRERRRARSRARAYDRRVERRAPLSYGPEAGKTRVAVAGRGAAESHRPPKDEYSGTDPNVLPGSEQEV